MSTQILQPPSPTETEAEHERRALVPFNTTGVAYLVLAPALAFVLMGKEAVIPTAGLVFISLLDLFFMAKLVQSVLSVVSNTVTKTQTGSSRLGTFAWLVLKVLSFLGLGAGVFLTKEAPVGATLLGLAALMVVPLVGGMFWWILGNRQKL